MVKGTVTLNRSKINKGVDGNLGVFLQNGSLALHKSENVTVGCYLVTSFRGDCKGGQTSGYCTLIDLETGYPKFEERCSRRTTMARVLSHLSPGDFGAEEAIKRGEYIELYKRDKYSIDLSFDKIDNEGWKYE